MHHRFLRNFLLDHDHIGSVERRQRLVDISGRYLVIRRFHDDDAVVPFGQHDVGGSAFHMCNRFHMIDRNMVRFKIV